jgi:glutamate synthase (NADPH/NADH) large chain/glutamate synthase (ferredoxin)
MLFVDTTIGKLYHDEEIKLLAFKQAPYAQWLTENLISLKDLPEVPLEREVAQESKLSLVQMQSVFGFTEEELKRILRPMAVNGEEPISSMGNDTPLAILSERPQLLFKYFKQLFAQVTNPPIDPIREHLVMSLVQFLGSPVDLWSKELPSMVYIRLESPILRKEDFAKVLQLNEPNFYRVEIVDILFGAKAGNLETALRSICEIGEQLVRGGTSILVLSDRKVAAHNAAIPSLLAVSAIHQHLITKSLRTGVSLVLETGEARDVHQMACLLGFGAEAIYPYLAFESINTMGIDGSNAAGNYCKAIQKGLLKIFSKMGISTLQSYCGAQIFEAVGLSSELTKSWFGDVPSRIGGLTIELLEKECLLRHENTFGQLEARLDPGGEIHYRQQGEAHYWNPETISHLQKAARTNSPASYREFTEAANEENKRCLTLRGLLQFSFSPVPVALEEVEPVQEIVKRFNTGAMSLGAISREAHETLAIAMNRMGGKSNTGEGGEDPIRYISATGDSANSAIKQIASGRFGVTGHYLVNARELQIKMAQGAKPGEGGQLPGHKVDDYIALLRHSTPGVQLISPPPHHDIYSIEDLAQLILDLRHSNDQANISVKLVSEVGIGAVAAGVAKAQADKIVVSGDSGGTGASPISSIKHAGLPWELGLAEAHQTLLLNQLRSRICLETDGQLRTGRDVVIAALLGADEFGFATAPLIVEGCLMMRKCHLNTCPVGIATQDPELRSKFSGRPEYLVNYFFFVAEEVRQLMAKLGFRNFSEMVGRSDKLKMRSLENHWKARTIDLSKILFRPDTISLQELAKREKQIHVLDDLAYNLVNICKPALTLGKSVALTYPIQNTDRAVGTLLSSRVVKNFGPKGLPDNQIKLQFYGSAGQSFGAFLAPGITLELKGETNDYLGKGLSGGNIVIYPEDDAAFNSESAILVGNTAFYGATSGKAFISGRAGERFAVRNSGATIVVEGVGDHGCEYMTGGTLLVLGKTGRNFAAGMSGGFAYVLDEELNFSSQCNRGMVELQALGGGADEILLLDLIREHLARTGSLKARRMLANWNHFKAKIIKVVPTEYKKAMGERAEAVSCLNK